MADMKVMAIDLDGVIYQGETMMTGADAAVHGLRQHGWRVVFATNTSVRTRGDIAAKLTGMGIPAEQDEVFTSAFIAALLIKNIGVNRNVMAIGAEGLRNEIASAGGRIVSAPPCDALVVGMDTAFSYDKIRLAMEAIACGAVFIACNRDASFPGSNGHILPGCGPIVAAIEAAVGFPPEYMAGKPNVLMLETIAAQCRVKPREILVIGDGVESDIKMATAFGSPSVLVAPSASSRKPGTPEPTCTIRSLAELPSLLGG